MSTTTVYSLDMELTEAQARALAQFVKRVGWHEYINNAVDEIEAALIGEAVAKLQRALADNGYNPR